jgi:acetyltransferase-like isoleucine patch superfamily enzyme
MSHFAMLLRRRLVRGRFGRLVRDAVIRHPDIAEHVRETVVLHPEFARLAQNAVLLHPFVFGSPERVVLGKDVVLNNALLNTSSGTIKIGDYVFCGHGVSLLTGTHDLSQRGLARQLAIPSSGRDIVIGEGAWLASNATVVGPCVIGEHAVVAAGAVVMNDVPAGAAVGGVPARILPVERPR